MSAAQPRDPLEADMVGGAVRALRGRADALRKRAAPGGTGLDREPPVIIVASEAPHSLKIARDLDRIADALEAEGPL